MAHFLFVRQLFSVQQTPHLEAQNKVMVQLDWRSEVYS